MPIQLTGVSNAAPHDAPTKLIHGDQYIYETLLGLKLVLAFVHQARY